MPPELEVTHGCPLELAIPAEAHALAVPARAGSGSPKAASPARWSRRAARGALQKSPGKRVHEPANEWEVANTPAEEPLRPALGRARPSVPVGVVHVQNLGDGDGGRGAFVMSLHITRIHSSTDDLYAIGPTKEWGDAAQGRWLGVAEDGSVEIISHAKTCWRSGHPARDRALCWHIVAYDHYFSIRSALEAIAPGGWLYAPLPELDNGHRRVLTWTLQGHPSDDVDMRWSLSQAGTKPKGKAKAKITIQDVYRWKDVSEPKKKQKRSSARVLGDVDTTSVPV